MRARTSRLREVARGEDAAAPRRLPPWLHSAPGPTRTSGGSPGPTASEAEVGHDQVDEVLALLGAAQVEQRRRGAGAGGASVASTSASGGASR